MHVGVTTMLEGCNQRSSNAVSYLNSWSLHGNDMFGRHYLNQALKFYAFLTFKSFCLRQLRDLWDWCSTAPMQTLWPLLNLISYRPHVKFRLWNMVALQIFANESFHAYTFGSVYYLVCHFLFDNLYNCFSSHGHFSLSWTFFYIN